MSRPGHGPRIWYAIRSEAARIKAEMKCAPEDAFRLATIHVEQSRMKTDAKDMVRAGISREIERRQQENATRRAEIRALRKRLRAA